MRHNVRQHLINGFGQKVVKVKHVSGELGSGILDKNGREIFVGDKVRDNAGNEYTMKVKFYYVDKNCAALDKDDDWYKSAELEVVGHVSEEGYVG